MLEIKRLRSERDRIIAGLQKRNFSPEMLQLVDNAIQLDDDRRKAKTQLDNQLAALKKQSNRIGELFKSGQREEAESLRAQVAQSKDEIKDLESRLKEIESALETILLDLPNTPHESVVKGSTEDDNVVVETHGPLPDIQAENPLPHWQLADRLNLIDFKLGAKITGSGFPLFRNYGAQLQRALINFFLAEASRAGYEEIAPPLMVNAETAKATGQLPDKEGQMYHVEKDELYLIPTAEVPITNILRDEILAMDELPVKMAGYTPCFRREAGSYGSHVKGLNRVHQFDKVEIVQVTHPDSSYQALDEMVQHVGSLLQKLNLPYRILRLCGGDLGFTSALTYDFEVYSGAQERWLEVSSVSNFETFQANRLKLRYRDANGQTNLLHTLNGSALALARIIAALLENYQDDTGVYIPEILHPYLNFTKIEKLA